MTKKALDSTDWIKLQIDDEKLKLKKNQKKSNKKQPLGLSIMGYAKLAKSN